MKNEKVNRGLKIGAWNIFYRAARLLPIKKDKIIFESFLGRSYSDNPKAIYEELYPKHELEYIWFLNSKKVFVPGNAKVVPRISPLYLYHLATARYIVSNSRLPKEFVKRPGQTYLQTWHGTPLKKLVHDMKEINFPNVQDEEYYRWFDEDIAKWNYLLSPNIYSTKHFRSAFNYKGRMLETGYPRNDYLLNYTKQDIVRLHNDFNKNPGDKILLYTPTFRDDKYDKSGKYIQKVELDLDLLSKRCPEWKILIRTHYLIHEKIDFSKYKNIISVSEYDDINELYLVSDALLTDYSSTMFDYAILNKPMIFYAYDLEEYENKTRGMYEDYEKLIPGKNVSGTNELVKILKNFTNYTRTYQKKLDDFRKKYAYLEDGNASERVAEVMIEEINSEQEKTEKKEK